MKHILHAWLVAGLILSGASAPAAEPAGTASELGKLVQKIEGKIREGKRAEQDFADELKEFDALLAQQKGKQTEDAARVAWMRALLYLQVFENSEKAIPMLKQIKSDFPDTQFGKSIDNVLASLERQEAAKKIQASLVVGAKFPDFEEKDIDGKPISVAKYKGKVVLVDFWATWCGPCIFELPNVLATYEKHHGRGFEIIGISLDREEQALRKFVEEKKMPWQQYFDGKVWESKLAQKYGVMGIPATYLLNGSGTIIGKDLRGDELEKAVALALAKK